MAAVGFGSAPTDFIRPHRMIGGIRHVRGIYDFTGISYTAVMNSRGSNHDITLKSAYKITG